MHTTGRRAEHEEPGLIPSGMRHAGAARLLDRARCGDRIAQDAIYREYFDRIVRYATTRIGDWHEANDLAQDVMVRALDSLAVYDTSRPFEPWLLRIAHNRLVDHVRRQRISVVEDPLALARRQDERTGGDSGHGEDCERFLSLIGELTERQRRVLLLRYGLDLTSREVGATLRCSAGAARMLQMRGVAQLRPKVAAALGR